MLILPFNFSFGIFSFNHSVICNSEIYAFLAFWDISISILPWFLKHQYFSRYFYHSEFTSFLAADFAIQFYLAKFFISSFSHLLLWKIMSFWLFKTKVHISFYCHFTRLTFPLVLWHIFFNQNWLSLWTLILWFILVERFFHMFIGSCVSAEKIPFMPF